VVVVEAAFGLDASLTVVFAGVLAARHHQGTARVDAWRVRRCADGRGGLAQRWKEQPATGMGRVDLPTGRSPDDGAVGQLSSQPTPKRLEQVMFSTQAPQIRRTGRPPGYGIVWSKSQRYAGSSQPGNRHVISRQRTKIGQRPGRHVARFRRPIPGMDERPNPRLTDHLGGQQRRRHDPATDHHHRVRPRRAGNRVGANASAIVISRNGLDSPGRAASTPSSCTGVSSATLRSSAMTCTTVAPGAAWSAAAHGYHVKMAVTRPDLSAPQRGRIKPIHPAVDGRLGLRHRHQTRPRRPPTTIRT
jgi:hypothetical protein